MIKSILPAWGKSTVILAIIYMIWSICILKEKEFETLIWVLWLSPFLSAFVVAYLHPKYLFILGFLIGLTTTVFALLSNIILQKNGVASDFSGINGQIILAVYTMIYAVLSAWLGCALGRLLSIKSSNQA